MSSTEEAAIRDLIAARASTVNVADLEAMLVPIADDAVVFDVIGGLSITGKSAAREDAKAWLDLYDGPPRWEDREVTVAADGDIAFAHALSRVTGHRKDGVDVDMWFRTTLGMRRIDGEWRIVHDHGSVPFDAESGQASLGLKP